MAPDIAHLTAEIQQKAVSLVPNNGLLRQSLLESARSLVAALETPSERMTRMVQSYPLIYAATRTLIDLKVFRLLAESESPKSVAELAQITGADAILLGRLLKHIATEDFVQETGPDEYAANDMTRTIASPGGEGAIRDLFNGLRTAAGMPAFLKETKYTNPIDKDHTLWKYANDTDLHYFDYIFVPGREDMLEAFKNHMAFKIDGPKWFDDPNVMSGIFGNERLSDEDVLMIDVGGNTGHDLLNFKKAHGNMPGRLILQDLPSIISSLDDKALASQGVEAMDHDMFTPQPVKHAKAYFSKYVLHDWPAEQCKQALLNLKPALKPGYSRILLNELVVPERNAHWFETSLDILMMAVHSSQERREREWRELIESVDGLKVTKIWNVEGAAEKIIEIELA